jgi:GNAT superfamily N-acetyltransferase
MTPINHNYNGYLITTDKQLMQVKEIHKWLSSAYWSKHIPLETVKTAFEHSFCIGAVIDGKQVAYARLITDYATFGYLADVFVMEEHQGKGIGKKMMELLFDQEWVKSLRAIKLATKDAQELYRKYGFHESRFPERNMEIIRKDIYG